MNLLHRHGLIAICASVVLAAGIVSPSSAQVNVPPAFPVQDNPTQQVPQAGGIGTGIANPSLKLSPGEALLKLEPKLDEEYVLGAGDEISIQFPGRPELAAKSVIGPDGRITLPLAGPIVVVELTRDAAGQKIASALSKYYVDIAATVEVMRYGSNHVTLLGNVKTPGLIEFGQTPTLLEVLSRGGIENRPDGSLPEQCVVYRQDQVFWVDLQELLTSGSPLADLRLRRNDLIFVPAVTKSVTVIGQVQRPGQIPLRHDTTLTSILGEAGGTTEAAGNNPDIEIVHRSRGGTTQYIRFKDLLKQTGGTDVSLRSGDVIFVPRSGLYKVGFVMQQLSPFVVMGSLATLALH